MHWTTVDLSSIQKFRQELLGLIAEHIEKNPAQKNATDFRVLCAVRLRDACTGVGVRDALSFEISIIHKRNNSLNELIAETKLYNNSATLSVAYSALFLRLVLLQPAVLATTLQEADVPMFLLVENSVDPSKMMPEADYTEAEKDVYWSVSAFNKTVLDVLNLDRLVINSDSMKAFTGYVYADEELRLRTLAVFHNGFCGKLLSQRLQHELFRYMSSGNRLSGPTQALMLLKMFSTRRGSVLQGFDAVSAVKKCVASVSSEITDNVLHTAVLIRVRTDEEMSQNAGVRANKYTEPRNIMCSLGVDLTQVELFAGKSKSARPSALDLTVQLTGSTFVRERAVIGFVQTTPGTTKFEIKDTRIALAPGIPLLGNALDSQLLSEHICLKLAMLCRGYALLFDQTSSNRVIDEVAFRVMDSVAAYATNLSLEFVRLLHDWMAVYTAVRARMLFSLDTATQIYTGQAVATTVIHYANLRAKYKVGSRETTPPAAAKYSTLLAEVSGATKAVQINAFAAALFHMYCCVTPFYLVAQ